MHLLVAQTLRRLRSRRVRESWPPQKGVREPMEAQLAPRFAKVKGQSRQSPKVGQAWAQIKGVLRRSPQRAEHLRKMADNRISKTIFVLIFVFEEEYSRNSPSGQALIEWPINCKNEKHCLRSKGLLEAYPREFLALLRLSRLSIYVPETFHLKTGQYVCNSYTTVRS